MALCSRLTSVRDGIAEKKAGMAVKALRVTFSDVSPVVLTNGGRAAKAVA
jgi:hypothetical protein